MPCSLESVRAFLACAEDDLVELRQLERAQFVPEDDIAIRDMSTAIVLIRAATEKLCGLDRYELPEEAACDPPYVR